MKKRGSRTVDALQQLFRERHTTMPPGEAEAQRRAAAGPPAQPLLKVLDWVLQVGGQGLHLVTYLVDQQRYEDATGWWEGASEYVERVARLMKLVPQHLGKLKDLGKGLPFSAEDLQTRLERVKLLEIVASRMESLTREFKNTLLVERADLMRMADTYLTEIEMCLGRPSLDEPTRANLQKLAEIPLETWERWQERVQKTGQKNAALRDELAETQAELAAARAAAKADGEGKTLPAPPPAARRSRRR